MSDKRERLRKYREKQALGCIAIFVLSLGLFWEANHGHLLRSVIEAIIVAFIGGLSYETGWNEGWRDRGEYGP